MPFLVSCLRHEVTWSTTIYGLELFQSGQLLRAGETTIDSEIKYFLGWKGPDTGSFANIRQELDEEITSDGTSSAVLEHLGGNANVGTGKGVVEELGQLGHYEFMSLEGFNLSGYYEPQFISVKLMNCAMLKWPLLLELEKTAKSEEEAIRCEEELREVCRQFQFESRLVREEPPTLLYDALFSPGSG